MQQECLFSLAGGFSVFLVAAAAVNSPLIWQLLLLVAYLILLKMCRAEIFPNAVERQTII